jgi:hypothetical protein
MITETSENFNHLTRHMRGCIIKFLDWPPGARSANGTAVCHKMQLYRYFMSQYSEFCRHNPLCCFLTSVYCCKCVFRYRLRPATFGYTLVAREYFINVSRHESFTSYLTREFCPNK